MPHTHAIQNALEGTEKYIILTMTMFIGSQSLMSLTSFMLVSAAVREICKSRRIIGYFQLNTFLRHITDTFLKRSYLVTIYARSLVHHKFP